MDRNRPYTEIGRFRAELVRIDLDVKTDVESSSCRPVEVYAVADLDQHVDRARLLRDPTGSEPPYWTLVWIGARAIAARLRSEPPPVGTRVLDLGCGLGVSGVVAGLAGAHVTFADYVDDALAFARASARHHGLRHHRVARVDFTRDRLHERFDLILAADIVYDPAHYQALVDFLVGHLRPGGTILLTESLRADAKRVIERLVTAGFDDVVEAAWVMEDGRRERTWLHTLVEVSARDS